ncbi:M16 family metallopeptidase [Methylovirgula sp. 4M-Z18]|uniref:M16 family metallopeptidase n=1 Tax=Methylovirgula sp. 4M-Z18 TaxID=2293567 RepID=UPI000E2F598D|nr:pitrilysin family protein [Methylovirgula sp. 4M-Z18]RFB76389.1 insulinase family protein [Methylovirgula sp. 4M-Z18]
MSTVTQSLVRSRAETVQIVRSPGGIEAWLVEDYAVPLVSLEFASKGGSNQDPEGKAGAATLTAGLLDEGAGDLDAEAFQRALDDKAIELSFAAERDVVTGRLRTMVRNVDAAFEMLRLALHAPRFDEAAVARVKSQMQAGIRRETNDPDANAAKAFRQAAFPDHPYGLPQRGTLASVEALTRDDIVALHKILFARKDLKIAVVGAINARDLSALLDRVFAPLPAEAHHRVLAPITLQGQGTRQLVDLDIPQATIRFGLPGIARHDPDYIAATVVNHILGGGVFSARLFKEVREKRGLAYSVHSSLMTQDYTAALMGGTSTKNERALESLSVIEEEIAKLAADGPEADELEKAQKFLIGSYPLRFDTSTKIAGALVHIMRDGFTPDWLDARNVEIGRVTLADAKRVAERLFGNQKLLVAIAGRPSGV